MLHANICFLKSEPAYILHYIILMHHFQAFKNAIFLWKL